MALNSSLHPADKGVEGSRVPLLPAHWGNPSISGDGDRQPPSKAADAHGSRVAVKGSSGLSLRTRVNAAGCTAGATLGS